MRKADFKISDQEIINIYLKTKSLRQTAMAAQGITGTSTIAKKLRSLGVEVKNYKLKPIQVTDDELIRMYNSGMSLMEIASKVSGAKGAMVVRQKLQKLGVDTSYNANIGKYKEKMSQIFHRYSLDEHVFDTVDTEEKAYWLGFLMADGYNHEDKSTICLRLQAEDLEILEKFKNFLKSNAPIYTITRITPVTHLKTEHREVRVNSVYLSRQLAKLGCMQGKTYKLCYPKDVPLEMTNHFIRGYFDGDGCLSITNRNDRKNVNSKKYQFTITGKHDVLIEMQNRIISSTGIKKTAIQVRKDSFAQVLRYGGFNNILKIMKYLYKNATIYLKRKHDKYLEMVSRQSNLQK